MKKKIGLIIICFVFSVFFIKGVVNFINFYQFDTSETSNSKITDGYSYNQLHNGFYVKKGNKYYSVDYPDETYIKYLMIDNDTYYNCITMNAGDELIYYSDGEEDIDSGSDIVLYEDLNFVTIPIPFSKTNEDYLRIADSTFIKWPQSKEFEDVRNVIKIDSRPIKNLLTHDYFIAGLEENKEYRVSGFLGTTIKTTTFNADCHILKESTETTGAWKQSERGYKYLVNKFDKQGFYTVRQVVKKTGERSNRLTKFLIKYL